MMKVEILGPGCPNCEKLKENTKKAIEDLGLPDAEVVEIKDPTEIASKGVLNTPAIAIDGEIKLSGRVPSKEEIKELLE